MLILAEGKRDVRSSSESLYGTRGASFARGRRTQVVRGRCSIKILECLTEHGQQEDVDLIADQISDPSVRATAIACLRRFRPTPVHLIDTVEAYLYDPDSAVREQASRTVAVLYAAMFAANSGAI